MSFVRYGKSLKFPQLNSAPSLCYYFVDKLVNDLLGSRSLKRLQFMRLIWFLYEKSERLVAIFV